jgi:hypothetical protein
VRERVLSEHGERILLASLGERLLAVVLTDTRTLELHAGHALATLERVAVSALDSKVSRASLGISAGAAKLAFVDEQGRVKLAAVDDAGMHEPLLVASGADRRFAPALLAFPRGELVAFVRTVDELMHTFVARIHAGEVTLHDVTPEGHGACAPDFVAGAETPTLVMIDAHAGVSPLLELTFDAQGKAGSVSVRTPVSQPYAPPLLHAVELPNGDVEVAYTAVGKLAATAIGRVPLRRAAQPVALLPSKGYGELLFSAVRGPRRAAFAYEAPRTSVAGSTRSLEIVLLDDQGTGPLLSVGGDADARAPSLALHAGSLWLGYTRSKQAVIASLRCDLD